MLGLTAHFVLAIAFAAAGLLSATTARSQQAAAAGPETALSGVLSAACRQDSAAFTNFLTADNAAAYRSLAGPQQTALMKRFVLLEDPGRTLLSTGATGHPVIRCESPGISTEMRFGETRLRENLAFIPMEIPLPGEPSRSITFGLVREGGNWKVLSVGLILLDIPSMARQWEQADLEAREDNAIAALRTLATALETYRHAYGKLPDSLEPLGPAPKEGISPEAAGLVDADLAAGKKNGYEIRYRILPAEGSLPEDELAATPAKYGDAGKRSFFLDSAGVLRGDDKKGAVATSEDPRIGSPQSTPSQR
jgi:type II secretory pathway pseudopilin PulG